MIKKFIEESEKRITGKTNVFWKVIMKNLTSESQAFIVYDIKQQQIALIEKIVEMCESEKKPLAKKYRASFTEDERVGWWQIRKHNEALDTISSKLKTLIQ